MRAVLLALALAACVPASNDNLDPRGAAGAHFVPTPSSMGTPFTTSDGWTITIERLVLVAHVTAQCESDGGSGYIAWNAGVEAERWTGALPTGACALNVALDGLYSTGDSLLGERRSVDRTELASDIADDVFSKPDNPASSITTTNATTYAQGPAMVIALHATKGTEARRLSLRLAASFLSETDLTRVVTLGVRQNDVVYARYEVQPERMFTVGEDPTLVFEPLAEADRRGNDDGTISADELAATDVTETPNTTPVVCIAPDQSITTECASLLTVVAVQAQRVLVPAGN